MSLVGSHNRRIETDALRRVANAAAHYLQTGELDRLAELERAVRAWQHWRSTAIEARKHAQQDSRARR